MRPESGLSISETYDMKACRITTLFSGRGEGEGRRYKGPSFGAGEKEQEEGGFVVATRSRTPVALTSLAGNQFMKAYRIMTPFWARGEGEEEERRKKRRGEEYCRTQARRVIRSLL